ncbi:hypothetical protein CN553_11145 [Bacillus cereus]|uniref:Core-binding (CB) domain-containing protein n=1 Tax=Bacillus cereus TaxID=1396 RepID=A0A9X6YMZ4_BACCE|nr:site-specific integrase [Bacillus cereus]PEN98182.1 hypothetical protein CN553_11145 [Bacillus cereus]
MSNILFNEYKILSNQEYQFCVDTGLVEFKGNDNKPFYRKHALIMLKHKTLRTTIVHPLSAFIFQNWKYKSYNTQRLHAIHVCQFLNYVLIDKGNDFRLTSLTELTFEHGNTFLNELLWKRKTNSSVKNIERSLVSFYEFLARKRCSTHYTIEDFTDAVIPNNPKKNYKLSPFQVKYSNEAAHAKYTNLKAIEHTLPPKYILSFIRIAIHVAPSVALAIYLSLFGGLRIGEVANITLKDITPYSDSYGKGGMKVSLTSQLLRPDIKDINGTSYVKKPRLQFIYNIKNILPSLYKNHLRLLKEIYNSSDLSLTTPLFVNRDGKAMTGKSIRYHFEKIKKCFIEELSQSLHVDDVIMSINLKNTKWSFHIGRGTFTNLIAKVANNPYEVALSRGDTSIFSALTYMADTVELKNEIENLLDEFFKEC